MLNIYKSQCYHHLVYVYNCLGIENEQKKMKSVTNNESKRRVKIQCISFLYVVKYFSDVASSMFVFYLSSFCVSFWFCILHSGIAIVLMCYSFSAFEKREREKKSWKVPENSFAFGCVCFPFYIHRIWCSECIGAVEPFIGSVSRFCHVRQKSYTYEVHTHTLNTWYLVHCMYLSSHSLQHTLSDTFILLFSLSRSRSLGLLKVSLRISLWSFFACCLPFRLHSERLLLFIQ